MSHCCYLTCLVVISFLQGLPLPSFSDVPSEDAEVQVRHKVPPDNPLQSDLHEQEEHTHAPLVCLIRNISLHLLDRAILSLVKDASLQHFRPTSTPTKPLHLSNLIPGKIDNHTISIIMYF